MPTPDPMARRKREIRRQLKQMVVTPELIRALTRADERQKAGVISTFEAGLEQMEALQAWFPTPEVQVLLDALKDYAEGDDAALEELLGTKL